MKRLIIIVCFILSISLLSGCKDKEDTKDTKPVVSENENTQDNINNEDQPKENKEEVIDLEYVLYLTPDNENILLTEKYSVKSNDEKLESMTIEEIALNHLINFKGFEGYVTPIPKDTEVLKIEKDNRKIHIDLSKDFVDKMDSDKTKTELTIASIVNTLTVLGNFDKVIITIEGEKLEDLNGVSLNNEFEFFNRFFYNK